MKRTLSCLIAAVMIATLIPSTVFAGSSCKHVWGEWETYNDYTCCDREAYRYCEECYENETKVIPATTEHVWTEWYHNKSYYSCEDEYDYSFCDVCDTKKKVLINPGKEAHTWSEWSFEEDYACTDRMGYRQCEKCNEQEIETIAATAEHNWSEWEYPCLEQVAYRYCKDCQEADEKTLLAVTEHNCIDWEIWEEPTCIDKGLKASYCEDCDELQEVEIPATGIHKWSDWWLKEGTTCLTGGTSYRWCETCDKEETKPFAKIGKHTWSGWKVWDEATIGHAGNLINYCTVCSVDNYKAIKKIKTVKLSAAKFTYNGKVKNPTVTVKDTAGKKLVKGTDYTIKYKNSKGKVITKPTKAGKYKVAVTFKGKYRGTVTRTFTINPKGTSLKTVKAGNDKITVKWNKNTKQVTGYQIRYSSSSKFTKGTTKYTLVKGSNATSKTIKNLKDSKKYYVQIRTYKADNGTKVYSGWSKTKTVKTR